MHELSFGRQILKAVLHEVAGYPGAQVSRVKLRTPEALALNPASLRFCLEALSAGTQMDGAQLEIEQTPTELDCPRCGRVEAQYMLYPVCPKCGELGRIVNASELVIEEIELDGQEDQDSEEDQGQGPRDSG